MADKDSNIQVRSLFEEGRIYVSEEISMVSDAALERISDKFHPTTVQWFAKNRTSLARDILGSPLVWVDDDFVGPFPEDYCVRTERGPLKPIEISYSGCPSTLFITSTGAGLLLVRESLVHLGISDREEIEKIISLIRYLEEPYFAGLPESVFQKWPLPHFPPGPIRFNPPPP